MSKIKEIFDKDSDVIKDSSREMHEEFAEAIRQARLELGMSVSEMTNAAGSGPAMTARVNDSDANLTLSTIARYSAAVGKKAKIVLVDAE